MNKSIGRFHLLALLLFIFCLLIVIRPVCSAKVQDNIQREIMVMKEDENANGHFTEQEIQDGAVYIGRIRFKVNSRVAWRVKIQVDGPGVADRLIAETIEVWLDPFQQGNQPIAGAPVPDDPSLVWEPYANWYFDGDDYIDEYYSEEEELPAVTFHDLYFRVSLETAVQVLRDYGQTDFEFYITFMVAEPTVP